MWSRFIWNIQKRPIILTKANHQKRPKLLTNFLFTFWEWRDSWKMLDACIYPRAFWINMVLQAPPCNVCKTIQVYFCFLFSGHSWENSFIFFPISKTPLFSSSCCAMSYNIRALNKYLFHKKERIIRKSAILLPNTGFDSCNLEINNWKWKVLDYNRVWAIFYLLVQVSS